MKFKAGDKVRIINTGGLPPCDLSKVGVMIDPDIYHSTGSEEVHTKIDMGRPRRRLDPETCWWIREKNLELAVQKGQQLLFDFMEE